LPRRSFPAGRDLRGRDLRYNELTFRPLMPFSRITSFADGALAQLSKRLESLAPQLESPGAWPAEQLALCGAAGVFEWFVAPEHGGQGWAEAELLRGYVKLAAACLTTTFVITQRVGAMQRLAAGQSDIARKRLLPDLLAGRTFATVGISHLTTSRQHVRRPVLRAEIAGDGFILDGYSPWVTGAEFAQTIVLGATLDDGQQLLVALPTGLPGVLIEHAPELVGLSASRTGPVRLERVRVSRDWLLAGPIPEVMKQGLGARTGGLQTSALAIGLATAAIALVEQQATARRELTEPVEALIMEREALLEAMFQLASAVGGTLECSLSANELRVRANSLALRASQAALAAAKGAGYVAGHPAGRWCREALFFLVWSCPTPVLQANLCELAGIAD
jgi:alkylation response protein AidB-like acyl-CoA dehydrogenase